MVMLHLVATGEMRNTASALSCLCGGSPEGTASPAPQTAYSVTCLHQQSLLSSPPTILTAQDRWEKGEQTALMRSRKGQSSQTTEVKLFCKVTLLPVGCWWGWDASTMVWPQTMTFSVLVSVLWRTLQLERGTSNPWLCTSAKGVPVEKGPFNAGRS